MAVEALIALMMTAAVAKHLSLLDNNAPSISAYVPRTAMVY